MSASAPAKRNRSRHKHSWTVSATHAARPTISATYRQRHAHTGNAENAATRDASATETPTDKVKTQRGEQTQQREQMTASATGHPSQHRGTRTLNLATATQNSVIHSPDKTKSRSRTKILRNAEHAVERETNSRPKPADSGNADHAVNSHVSASNNCKLPKKKGTMTGP